MENYIENALALTAALARDYEACRVAAISAHNALLAACLAAGQTPSMMKPMTADLFADVRGPNSDYSRMEYDFMRLSGNHGRVIAPDALRMGILRCMGGALVLGAFHSLFRHAPAVGIVDAYGVDLKVRRDDAIRWLAGAVDGLAAIGVPVASGSFYPGNSWVLTAGFSLHCGYTGIAREMTERFYL